MINIEEFSEKYECGYILPMEDKSPFDLKIKAFDSIHIEFKTGSTHIFVLMNKKINTLQIAHESALKSLDILSVRGLLNTNIKVPLKYYVKWIKFDDEDISLEITKKSKSQIFSRQNKYGSIKIDRYPDCFRFYRLSQLSADIFESFRNLWLCFEWLLSEEHPMKTKERELDWIKRALYGFFNVCKDEDISKILSLENPTGIIENLYARRCSLFHAKSNRNYLVPNNTDDSISVRETLKNLTIIVNAMINRKYKIEFHSSWMNPTAFVDPYKNIFNNLKTHVSGIKSEGILDLKESIALSAQNNFAPCIHSVEEKKDCVSHMFKSHIDVSNIDLKCISRFSQIDQNGKELMAFSIDENISLKGLKSICYTSVNEFVFVERARTYNFSI